MPKQDIPLEQVPGITPRNTLTLLFCLAIFFSSVTWCMPDSFARQAITAYTAYFVYPLGIEQSWQPFVGDYTTITNWRFSQTYKDGSVVRNPLYSITPPSYHRSIMREFIARTPAIPAYREQLLTYLCQETGPLGKPVWVSFEVAPIFIPTVREAQSGARNPTEGHWTYNEAERKECH